MSTHIEAFTPDTDPEYRKHLEVYDTCIRLDVSLPKETDEYFNGDIPEERLRIELEEDVHYTIYSEDYSSGFEVDLDQLPEGVTKLRFTNSW